MMRRLIFILLLISLSFPSFGYSRITIERTWTIESDGSPYEFTGAVAVNNSNQRVVSVATSPGMDYYQDENGTIWVHREASGEEASVLRATAIVDIEYDTNITYDPPLPLKERKTTELTEFSQAMSSQAVKLAREESSLATIASLVEWVHSNVEYDLTYWGKIKSAREVFNERRGVCVEYTHLLISLARSLGFETRYVNGYVLANAWQPHAWAEIYVPGYGWLPADATFGQAGVLDNTHIAINYGSDQASAYDLLVTRDAKAKISVREKLRANFLSENPRGIYLDIRSDEQVAEVILANPGPEYELGSYSFLVPDVYGTSNTSIIVLAPYQVIHRYYPVNGSTLQNGFSGVPVSASFNDAKETHSVGAVGEGGELRSLCAPAFLLAILLFKLF